jgi:hypothetical protein
MDLERYDVPPLQPGERRRLDPADEALLQVLLRVCKGLIQFQVDQNAWDLTGSWSFW